MKEGIYLAFDVGGTSIKAGALDGSGQVLDHTLSHYESKSNGSSEEIIDHFVHLIVDQLCKADPGGSERIAGIGYAFPGPFDYEQGVSYIHGLDKFEALYGICVSDRLTKELSSNRLVGKRWDRETLLRFENDAALFALGEAHYGLAANDRRAVCLTLGTGIGSGFVDAGHLITKRDDVPENGWLYHLPFRSGIVEDYISRRGLLQLAHELGMNVPGHDVRELAELAIGGDESALRLFDEFGKCIAEALEPVLREFAPDVIVLGGQISKSGELFVPSFRHELTSKGINTTIEISKDSQRSTLHGIYHMLQDHREKK